MKPFFELQKLLDVLYSDLNGLIVCSATDLFLTKDIPLKAAQKNH